MTSKSFENGIKESLEYQLPIFDDILAEAQKPLSERPLAAAFYFVDYCIVDIKGDSKDNFLEKEWFKSIYKLIKQWYDDRYGSARKYSKDSFALGVALIYKTPFELKIPLSIAQEWEGNDKRWFCHPTSVHENENVFDWIKKVAGLGFIVAGQRGPIFVLAKHRYACADRGRDGPQQGRGGQPSLPASSRVSATSPTPSCSSLARVGRPVSMFQPRSS